MKTKPWIKDGASRIIGEGENRRLINQGYIIDGKKTNYVLYNSSGKMPAIIFPLTSNLEVIALKQFRPGVDRIVIELPGGGIDSESEAPMIAAKRELFEETGYKSSLVLPLYRQGIWFDPSVFSTYFYPFIAINCSKTGREEHELIVVTIEKWLDLCYSGNIIDSKTLATTFLAQQHIKKLKRS